MSGLVSIALKIQSFVDYIKNLDLRIKYLVLGMVLALITLSVVTKNCSGSSSVQIEPVKNDLKDVNSTIEGLENAVDNLSIPSKKESYDSAESIVESAQDDDSPFMCIDREFCE